MSGECRGGDAIRHSRTAFRRGQRGGCPGQSGRSPDRRRPRAERGNWEADRLCAASHDRQQGDEATLNSVAVSGGVDDRARPKRRQAACTIADEALQPVKGCCTDRIVRRMGRASVSRGTSAGNKRRAEASGESASLHRRTCR